MDAIELARKMISESPSGMGSYDNYDWCQGYRDALYKFIERFEKEKLRKKNSSDRMEL